VKRFRGGLVCKAHRLLYHSTLGSRVIKKKKKEQLGRCEGLSAESQGQHLALTVLHVPSSLDSGYVGRPVGRRVSVSTGHRKVQENSRMATFAVQIDCVVPQVGPVVSQMGAFSVMTASDKVHLIPKPQILRPEA